MGVWVLGEKSMLRPKVMYKIRDGVGQFSSGGYRPTFSQRGTVWRTAAHVRAHLAQPARVPADWVVVQYQIVEMGKPTSAAEWVEELAERRREEARRRVEAERARVEDQEKILLAKLMAKYGEV